MASSSRKPQEKESFKVQLVSNKVKKPYFQPIPKFGYKNDPFGALSVIPPKVVMVQNIRRCYNSKIGAIGDMEMREAYDRLCENVVLKGKYKIVETKGLTHALEFPIVFKT